MNELKPCPFCGSYESEFKDHPESCFLHRLQRQLETNSVAYCLEDMEASWNTRHIPEGYALVPNEESE